MNHHSARRNVASSEYRPSQCLYGPIGRAINMKLRPRRKCSVSPRGRLTRPCRRDWGPEKLFLGKRASRGVRHSPAISREVLGGGAPGELCLVEWASQTLSQDATESFRGWGPQRNFSRASGRVRHSPTMSLNVLELGSQENFSRASGRVGESDAPPRCRGMF